ncbi:MAG: FMN-binding protein [Candidatus Muirbacterium halophilum]|nr:FMN-binding protein [Candidatus Muirbacterium halophilum]MCK9475978.1 FMN-binding protein [Candidatus Muirbacterium halophilum]
MGNIIKLGFILMIFCLVSAISLSYINDITLPLIKSNSQKNEALAKQSLFVGNILDLTKFPEREYIINDPNNEKRRVLLIKKTKVYVLSIDSEFFGIAKNNAKKEMEDIEKVMNTDQLIDIKKSPLKHKKLYEFIIKAFASSISFEKKKVAVDVYGVDIPINDDLSSSFRGSELIFRKLQNNKIAFEKVDNDYFEKIVADKKILFNDSSSLEIDSRENSFKVFSYDKVQIGDYSPGYVFKISPNGYSSCVQTLVAVDNKGNIAGLKIVSQQETPGLGAKCQENWFQNQFKGVGLNNLYLTKNNKLGKIDSITAATITSQAVTSGVRAGLEDFLKIIGRKK